MTIDKTPPNIRKIKTKINNIRFWRDELRGDYCVDNINNIIESIRFLRQEIKNVRYINYN